MSEQDRDSFPRRSARTRRFTLGQPRSLSVAEDGSRVAFLRAPSGDDPATCLWILDVHAGVERLVADPRALLGGGEEDLPPEERARRERTRESASGVVAYATDAAFRTAAFALAGRLFAADLVGGGIRELPAAGPVIDPRPDPTGRHVAYVTDGALNVVVDDRSRVLASEDDPDVSWGLAEFIAAEEMDRFRGFWWSPDGERVAAARVDNAAVPRWYIANPSDPAAPPQEVRYPAAGTTNADVSLWVLGLDGSRVEVRWDRDAFPYLVTVAWSTDAPLALLVQSRDQRRTVLLQADPGSGRTLVIREDEDPVWVEIVQGVPAWVDDGRLVFTQDRDETRRLTLADEPVTPPGLHVRRVIHAGRDVVFTASVDPTEVHVWRASPGGELVRLTEEPGVHDAVAGGGVVAIVSATTARPGTVVTVLRGDLDPVVLASHALDPGIKPNLTFLRAGPRELRTAVILPQGHEPGSPLPVLLDPYGGPHAQRVIRAQDAFLHSQWFADQGFAVVVADGRGTPGRGPAWERAVHLDLAGPVLDDQVDALMASAEERPELDLSRVAIRGWSFGGYLAALAVLRRPDVFHAAVVGAPVTDWRLYDTHYTERYLGHPDVTPEAYARSSLLDEAENLSRPMLLIHGLADDNVVVAHTLRFSQALLEAGRPHSVLPLSGVTHMTPQEVVAENVLLLQVAFLREALRLEGTYR